MLFPRSSTPDSAQATTILAAGLNPFGQLPTAANATADDESSSHYENLYTFNPLSLPPLPESFIPIFSSWSTTAFASRHSFLLSIQGHQHMGETSLTNGIPQSPFGDHNGLIGFVNPEGELIILENPPSPSSTDAREKRQPPKLTNLANPDGLSPKLGYVAMAGNERVAITFRQAPNGNLCHVLEFSSLPAFLVWYKDPSGEATESPLAHHMQQGRPRQLLATAAGFLMLMEDGDVYSWGDGRYASLGRSISREDSVPPEKPGVVPALEGLRISKIATGTGMGWVGAALDEANKAAYIWGRVGTGADHKEIGFLADLEPGGVYCVETAEDAGGEAMDVLDIGVGNGFVLVLVKSAAGERQVFGVGDNSRGQLGLGEDVNFAEGWTRVPGLGAEVKEVFCGSYASFLIS